MPGSPFLIRTLGLPGTSFVVAMVLAGVLVRALGVLPRGISFSVTRVVGALLFGLVAYPAGFLAVFTEVWALFAWSKRDTPGAEHGVPDIVIGYVTVGGIIVVGIAITLVILTAAFALATRYWPRRAFRRIALLSCVTILGGMFASLVHFLVYLQRAPDRIALQSFFADPLLVFFSMAWGLPLLVFVGEPLLAALFGHWFYLAAGEWAMEARE